jgi:hypothetical protein
VLRGLLREQVSVLNLRRIVELLLRHETTVAGPAGPTRPPARRPVSSRPPGRSATATRRCPWS